MLSLRSNRTVSDQVTGSVPYLIVVDESMRAITSSVSEFVVRLAHLYIV